MVRHCLEHVMDGHKQSDWQPEPAQRAWHAAPCGVCGSPKGCLRCGESTACRWTSSDRVRHLPKGAYFLHGPEAPPLPGELPFIEHQRNAVPPEQKESPRQAPDGQPSEGK